MVIRNLLPAVESGKKMSAAIFMSGSGTNAENILEYRLTHCCETWYPAVIVTDAPESSRAGEIAARFDLPLVAFSIREFYRSHGEKTISLKTERGRQLREMWTNLLREKLAAYKIDFGVLAGFVLLSNITGDFPCLNVHPGDLTVEENGRRLLVGLHALPVETAIVRGLNSIRSSVIIAQPYTGRGGEKDSGPILGISSALPLDLCGSNAGELTEIYNSRPEKKPAGGYRDKLEEVAMFNQERLKCAGDWLVLPETVADFAAGRFGIDNDELYYLRAGDWIKVKTVEYTAVGPMPVL
ncbi:MAG: hypothetical protein WC071_02880 [Victivallaceae bacterium]